MSETTIADVQNEIAALRRELNELRAAPPPFQEQADAGAAIHHQLKQKLAEKDKQNGIAVGSLCTQIRGNGGAGTAYSVVTITAAADLPTDEQIAEKIARLSLFVQNPLVLRALRCLLEPHFENQDKRRTKADLAASLGVSEGEVEAALTPLLDHYEVTWGKDASGQEYYKWTGNTFAMTLLIHG